MARLYKNFYKKFALIIVKDKFVKKSLKTPINNSSIFTSIFLYFYIYIFIFASILCPLTIYIDVNL